MLASGFGLVAGSSFVVITRRVFIETVVSDCSVVPPFCCYRVKWEFCEMKNARKMKKKERRLLCLFYRLLTPRYFFSILILIGTFDPIRGPAKECICSRSQIPRIFLMRIQVFSLIICCQVYFLSFALDFNLDAIMLLMDCNSGYCYC